MSDAPQISIEAPLPDPAPRPVIRTKGKLARKKPGPAKGFRAGVKRTAEPRTADDAQAGPGLEMAPAPPPKMPRDIGTFTPEYDGPGRRLSGDDRDTNQFELPAGVRRKLTNAGWDWAFKVTTIYNQPVDGTELLMVHNAGWRPAKAKDFPELVAPGSDPNASIDRHGQRLFIRPAHMTREAQQEDYNRANSQMKSRMQQTQEGKSLNSSEGGLADMGRVVQSVPIKLEVEGESGTHGVR